MPWSITPILDTGRPVGLWLYGPQLTVEHRDEPLAQFQVAYAPGKRLFKAVAPLRLFETPFRSPQSWLFPSTTTSGAKPSA